MTFKITLGGAAAAGVLAAVGRAAAVPPMLPDLDSVNFARALERFDLTAQAPHFPGYPVYVALSRLAAAAGAGEVQALTFPALVLATVGAAALVPVLARHLEGAGALAAAALWALFPLPVLFGATPGSDGAGAALLLLAVCAALATPAGSVWASIGAGAVAALSLGARPSYLCAALPLILTVPGPNRRWWALGAAVGGAAWFVPLALLTAGPRGLWRVGSAFLRGHGGEWGGTVAVRPDLLQRAELFGFDVTAAGLGLPWTGAWDPARWIAAGAMLIVVAALGQAAFRAELTSGERRVAFTAVSFGAPYALWMFVGQNLLKSRHALPVVIAAVLLLAVGVSVLWRRRSTLSWGVTAALSIALVAVSAPLVRDQGRAPSPAAQLVRHVEAAIRPTGAMLFTGEEARLFEHYAPYYRAGRAATGEQLRREAELVAGAGVAVYVTSSAPGADALRARLVPVARFECSRLARSHAHTLILYRYLPAAPGRAEGML